MNLIINNQLIPCDKCKNTGLLTCSECKGRGRQPGPCPSCKGKGGPCILCNGKGYLYCYICLGAKKVSCDKCGGTGWI